MILDLDVPLPTVLPCMLWRCGVYLFSTTFIISVQLTNCSDGSYTVCLHVQVCLKQHVLLPECERLQNCTSSSCYLCKKINNWNWSNYSLYLFTYPRCFILQLSTVVKLGSQHHIVGKSSTEHAGKSTFVHMEAFCQWARFTALDKLGTMMPRSQNTILKRNFKCVDICMWL